MPGTARTRAPGFTQKLRARRTQRRSSRKDQPRGAVSADGPGPPPGGAAYLITVSSAPSKLCPKPPRPPPFITRDDVNRLRGPGNAVKNLSAYPSGETRREIERERGKTSDE